MSALYAEGGVFNSSRRLQIPEFRPYFMPGLFGVFSERVSPEHEDLLGKMRTALLQHHPRYDCGTFVDPRLGVALGWTSLKCPGKRNDIVWNYARDLALAFSGEHFSGSHILNHGLGESAAKEILAEYEASGAEIFARLNGVFHGVLLDFRARSAFLFIDRYGLSRIYYHQAGNEIYFASEAKALLSALPRLRAFDSCSLGEFFACGAPLQNRTLFRGISLLPGAALWRYSAGFLSKETFFNSKKWESLETLAPETYYERLRDTFNRILPKYLCGGNLSLSLTGGLDSRMIIASSNSPRIDACHSFGGMYRDCADVVLARRVAKAAGAHHTILPVSRDFFSQFPDLARQVVCISDGAMDVSASVELFLNRQVARMTDIRLTGNYGSEVLRQHVAFRLQKPNHSILDPEFSRLVTEGAERFRQERSSTSPLGFIAFKQVPWYHHARWSIEQSQLTVRSPYLDNELVALAFRAPSDSSLNKRLIRRYIAEENPDLSRIPTDRGFFTSAGSGRVATFFQELIPRAEYAFDYGMPQWLCKIDRILAPTRWERLFLGHQKFYHFRSWYRDALAPFVRDSLLSGTSRLDFFDPRRVRCAVEAHLAGCENHTLLIHKLISMQFIRENLVR